MNEFVTELELGGFDHITDRRGVVWQYFSVTAQPSYVFINDDGKTKRYVGALEPEALAKEIRRLQDT